MVVTTMAAGLMMVVDLMGATLEGVIWTLGAISDHPETNLPLFLYLVSINMYFS